MSALSATVQKNQKASGAETCRESACPEALEGAEGARRSRSLPRCCLCSTAALGCGSRWLEGFLDVVQTSTAEAAVLLRPRHKARSPCRGHGTWPALSEAEGNMERLLAWLLDTCREGAIMSAVRWDRHRALSGTERTRGEEPALLRRQLLLCEVSLRSTSWTSCAATWRTSPSTWPTSTRLSTVSRTTTSCSRRGAAAVRPGRMLASTGATQ